MGWLCKRHQRHSQGQGASGHTTPGCAELGIPRADWETSRALNPLSSCQEGENVPSARTLLGVCLTVAGDVVWVLARPTPVFSPRVPPCHPWK